MANNVDELGQLIDELGQLTEGNLGLKAQFKVALSVVYHWTSRRVQSRSRIK